MALPVVVPVGKKTADELRERLIAGDRDAEGRRLHRCRARITARSSPPRTRRKIEDYIQMGVDEGAELVVDGRGFTLQGYEKGFFIGPTLFDHVKPDDADLPGRDLRPRPADRPRRDLRGSASRCRASTSTATASPSSPATATPRASSPRRVNVGMVGINVPIPVPVAYHTFGGWKRSAFGDTNQHGMEGVRFWTKVKTVTARWPEGDDGRFELRHPDDALVEVLEFIAVPTAVALLPAAIAAWRRRGPMAFALVAGGLLVTLGVPMAIGMWGTSSVRPGTITVGLLAAIVLVWPLAIFSFALGSLIAIGPKRARHGKA